jgi:Phage tail assembly chaperone protein
MVYVAIINLSTDAIEHIYEAEAPNQAQFGGPWGRPSQTVHVALPEGLDKDVAGAVKQQDGSYVLGIDQDKYAAKEERKWKDMRTERNARLTKCDWTQLSDAPLTAEKKQAWMAYRQELRDFPSVVDINNIVWPTPP